MEQTINLENIYFIAVQKLILLLKVLDLTKTLKIVKIN